MTPGKEFWDTLKSANSTVARSSVVAHIFPYFLSLLVAIVALAIANAHEWLILCGVGGVGFLLFVYVCAFVYCLIYDRESLRSERFHLDKLMIERGIVGDSTLGMFRQTDDTAVLQPVAMDNESNLTVSNRSVFISGNETSADSDFKGDGGEN